MAELDHDRLVTALASWATQCGPFFWGGDSEAADHIRAGGQLAPVPEGLVHAHRDVLVGPVVLDGQWMSIEDRAHLRPDPPAGQERRLFQNLTDTYECGEFPGGVVKTHDPLPDEAFGAAVAGDDSFVDDGTSVWRFPVVAADPVVHEVVVPDDWMGLLSHGVLEARPFRRVEHRWRGPDGEMRTALCSSHAPWDCTVTDVDDAGLATIRTADGRIIGGVRGLVMPDWPAVADRHDAVHFTWAGILTTEARLVEWRDGWLSTARFWGTPSTLWFKDVFGPAEPLPLPAVRGATRRMAGALPDQERLAQDRRLFRSLFGPQSAVPG